MNTYIGMQFIRRLAAVTVGLGCFLAPLYAPAQDAAPAGDAGMVVTLLGTGQPITSTRRYGFSNLVQAGGLTLMFDAGRGAATRLGQLQIPVGSVDAVFLTHFHSDHVNGLSDIFLTGYLGLKTLGGRQTPLQVYGPPGTANITDNLKKAFSADAAIRHADEGLALNAMDIEAHEFEPGVVFEQNGVKVIAFNVDHGEAVKPAVGYRVEYNGHAVLFSGDTKYSENVISNGQKTDVLVHEMAVAPPEMSDVPLYQRILGHHTSPEEAGEVFEKTKPGIAVYSHMGRLPGPNGLPSWAEVIARTRTNYSGPLVIGEDLMRFYVSDAGVAISLGGAE